MRYFFIVLAILFKGVTSAQTAYELDFDEFWQNVSMNYAYIEEQKINWDKVREIYRHRVKLIKSKSEFVEFLETVINEFHNGHISLNTNLSSSNRIIPSGQDLFIQKKNGKYIVADLRKGFSADKAGLRIGDEILFFNDNRIAPQAEQFLPKFATRHSEEMHSYANNMLFAGRHNVKRKFTIRRNDKQMDFYLDSFKVARKEKLIETRILSRTTALIKINDALGNFETIGKFDTAVDMFLKYPNLVIDLTETPSGGNTTVARCIMGRFVKRATPYQRHEFDEKEFQTKRSWVEFVTPRKIRYSGALYILVGRWTGSMAEGIAIGFDGMSRATIIGAQMAGLLGAVNGYTLSETKIGYQIPTERLYHINGTSREKYRPGILTNNINETMIKLKGIK